MPSGPPSWLKTKKGRRLKKWDEWWQKPWTVPQSSSQGRGFKECLWDHGHLSPNFTRAEASGKSRHPLGSDVPSTLRTKAQYHAFGLERVRHDCGDQSMRAYSWYRDPDHNSAVGGATASQHRQAWATDWDSTTRSRLGGTRFDTACNRHFSNGGRGYQGHVGGPIRHVDNGPARVWVYA